MECMMVLLSPRQMFGIILIISMVIFAFGLPVIVTKLTRPKTAKDRAKQQKRCTAKTTGNIIDMDYNVPLEYRDIHNDNGPTVRMIAKYEFFVNGIRYTGSDYIYNLPGQKTVNVLYDPNDPSNNCTPWGRKVENGTEHIIPMLIVFGVIAFIVFSLVLISALLGSRYT